MHSINQAMDYLKNGWQLEVNTLSNLDTWRCMCVCVCVHCPYTIFMAVITTKATTTLQAFTKFSIVRCVKGSGQIRLLTSFVLHQEHIFKRKNSYNNTLSLLVVGAAAHYIPWDKHLFSSPWKYRSRSQHTHTHTSPVHQHVRAHVSVRLKYLRAEISI